jgi:hypothetical protein
MKPEDGVEMAPRHVESFPHYYAASKPTRARKTICLFIVNTVSLAWLFFRTENHFAVFSRVSFTPAFCPNTLV